MTGHLRLGLAFALVALVACTASAPPSSQSNAPSSSASTAPQRGGTLIVGRGADSVTLDPNDSSELEGATVTSLIFETLVRFKPGTLETEPWLAQSWETSSDRLTWHFHLRPNVKFTDGSPLNAKAVEFTFMRFLDPKNDYYKYGKWQLAQSVFSQLKEVKAVGDLDVDFILKQPFAPILTALATSRGGIVSPSAIQKDPQNAFKTPVGTGPFMLQEWRKDDTLTIVPNPNYWSDKDRPYLDKIIFKVIPDNSARLLALQNGDVNMMTSISPTAAKAITSSSTTKLLDVPGLLHAFLSLNTTHKPLDNVKVREAIYRAINRDQIVAALFTGATVAKGVMPPLMLGFDGTIQWPTYDPAAAKQELADAGYPNGFKMSLYTFSDSRPYLPDPPKTAQAIQADLAKVGITVDITTADVNTIVDKMRKADFDLAMTGFNPAVPDPWLITYTQFDSRAAVVGNATNFAFYRNPDVDALNDQGTNTSDPAARVAIYKQIQQILRRDVVRVDIADVDDQVGLRQEVQDLKIMPQSGYYLQYVWLKK